jgi:hypothetical protein
MIEIEPDWHFGHTMGNLKETIESGGQAVQLVRKVNIT